mmetsp:Transcript_109564/g.353615  ORF Transcript_109564/g.353615 Transcript_109564/m.353615 type:complete len:915 (+) Transcript_109564:37-2781(+)
MCSNYTESTQASPRYVELRYTKFTISGVPGEKHAVLIPDGLRLTPEILQQICAVLDREVPSALLCGRGSLRHPSRISTRQLRDCQAFRQLMQDAGSSLGLQESPDEQGLCEDVCGRSRPQLPRLSELRISDADPASTSLADVANRVLEQKIASTVSGIATAAFRANAWTLSWPQISSFEVFLQQCVENGEADVCRLVVGHLQDRAYMECETSRQFMQLLFNKSQAMSPRVVNKPPTVCLPGDLWNPARNTRHREFAEHGFDYWSFNTYEDSLSRGHPITQWPWPYANLFFLFYREETSTVDAAHEPDWEFTTKARLDQDAIPFDPDQLAPVAYVFIGGNELNAKKKLLHTLKAVSPVIIMDNTPSVPKQMSLFVDVIKRVWRQKPLVSCKPFLAEGVHGRLWGSHSVTELFEAMSPSKILNHVEKEFDTSGMDEGEKLALSDLVGLLDLVKRRPQAFRETVCVVDPLQGSMKQVVSQITAVLNSHHGNSREQSPTEGQRSMVFKSWRLHRKLARKAEHFRRLALSLVFAIALAMLLTTLLAVAAVSLALQKAGYKEITYHVAALLLSQKLELSVTWSEAERALNAFLLILPVCAGLLTMLHAHFQFSQKWSSAYLVSNQVVSEIYHFLGKLGPYAATSTCQREFMKRLHEMTKQLSVSGIQEDELMENGNASEEGFPKDSQALEQHIDYYLYGIKPPSWLRRKARHLAASLGGSCTAWLVESHEPRDLAAPLTAELYMKMRLVPLRKHYSNWVQSLRRLRAACHLAFVLCLALASGLGASGLLLWVPAPLGIATFVAALEHWLAPPELLTGVNNALAALSSLDLRWEGSQLRENRTEASKQRLIRTTERVAHVVSMILAGVSTVAEEPDEEDAWASDVDVRGAKAGEKRCEQHVLCVASDEHLKRGRSFSGGQT